MFLCEVNNTSDTINGTCAQSSMRLRSYSVCCIYKKGISPFF